MRQACTHTIPHPGSVQPSQYYSALYQAPDHSWTAKFISISANGWNTVQSTWLQNTLNVNTTYTFTIRHEPANDARAPGVTPSESMMSSSFNGGHPTLSTTGHTHLVQPPGRTPAPDPPSRSPPAPAP